MKIDFLENGFEIEEPDGKFFVAYQAIAEIGPVKVKSFSPTEMRGIEAERIPKFCVLEISFVNGRRISFEGEISQIKLDVKINKENRERHFLQRKQRGENPLRLFWLFASKIENPRVDKFYKKDGYLLKGYSGMQETRKKIVDKFNQWKRYETSGKKSD